MKTYEEKLKEYNRVAKQRERMKKEGVPAYELPDLPKFPHKRKLKPIKRGQKKKRVSHRRKAIEKELAAMSAEMQRLRNRTCRSNYEEASLRVVTNRYNYLLSLLQKKE